MGYPVSAPNVSKVPPSRIGIAPPSRIAIATCAELPALDLDGPALLSALSARGVKAEPAVWDDPRVAWDAFDAVVVRCTWDYVGREGEFVDWAARLPRVANPASILEWNIDKHYLADLAEAGCPTVATRFAQPSDPVMLPSWPEYVVKPTVSAGSADTARWRRDIDDEAAVQHLRALRNAGRAAMIQPYLEAVDTVGESALIYLGGRFSHCVRKAPILAAGAAPSALAIGDHDPREQIVPRDATAAELAVAEVVLDAVPGGREQLLYARVDLIPDESGEPVLLELEVTEPSLFLWAGPGAAERLADAIVAFA